MSRRIRFLPTAERDLDLIWAYRSQFGIDVADRLMDRLRAAVGRLADHPFSAPGLLGTQSTVRRLSAFGHIFIYEIEPEQIAVLRIFDARQDWLSILRHHR